MKSIIPTYVLIIGFTILVMSGVSLICVQAQISSARDAHTSSLSQIQAAAYDEETVRLIQEEIKNKYGWELVVEEQTVFKDRRAMRITLNYDITIPFLNMPDKTASITAYGK